MPIKKECPMCKVMHNQRTKRCEKCHTGNYYKPRARATDRSTIARSKRCDHQDEYNYGDGVFVCANCGTIRREDS